MLGVNLLQCQCLAFIRTKDLHDCSSFKGDTEGATASHGAKKRKVSSYQSGTEATGGGQQADTKGEASVHGDAGQ